MPIQTYDYNMHNDGRTWGRTNVPTLTVEKQATIET